MAPSLPHDYIGVLLTNVTREDVIFIEPLKESEFSTVFKVDVGGLVCVMKVYHSVKPSPLDPPDREVDIFKCESRAYQRLKERGLCKRHLVPEFFGVVEQIDPRLWQPYLDVFLEDELRSNAVLMEYISTMREFDLDSFSPSRLQRCQSILDEIHAARVLHSDPYPRNIMVQEETDRVLWIDFDRAQTYAEGKPLTSKQEKSIATETAIMDAFARSIEEDYRSGNGKLQKAWNYYYVYG